MKILRIFLFAALISAFICYNPQGSHKAYPQETAVSGSESEGLIPVGGISFSTSNQTTIEATATQEELTEGSTEEAVSSADAVYSQGKGGFVYQLSGQELVLSAQSIFGSNSEAILASLGISEGSQVELEFADTESTVIQGVVKYKENSSLKEWEYSISSRLIAYFHLEGDLAGKINYIAQDYGGWFRWADNNSMDSSHVSTLISFGWVGPEGKQYTQNLLAQKYFYDDSGNLTQIEYYTSTGGIGFEVGGLHTLGRYTYRIDKFNSSGEKISTLYFNDPHPSDWDPEVQGIIIKDSFGRYFLLDDSDAKWLIISKQEDTEDGAAFLNTLLLEQLAVERTPVKFSGDQYSTDTVYFDSLQTNVLAVRSGEADAYFWIKFEADYLLDCQFVEEGNLLSGAINNVYGDPTWIVPRESAMALLALLQSWQSTGESVYLERAKAAADFLVRIQDSDGAWYNQYNYLVPGDPSNPDNTEAWAKSPTQTAEVMIALYKLGYDASRYEAMKKAAQYLLACQDPGNKGGLDDGLLGGGKDELGNYRKWRWASDNSYAYQGLKAAAEWARESGNFSFAVTCEEAAEKIIQGINTYFYIKDASRSDYGVWYRVLDENGAPIDPEFHDWINYAPQMLDLPAQGVGLPQVGEWIHQTFQAGDGSIIWNDGVESNRKSPGFSFQAVLVWNDLAQYEYVSAAIDWARKSGLWNTLHDEQGISGGWIDWIADSTTAPAWQRFIDTSFYFISSLLGGYDFRCGEESPPVIDDLLLPEIIAQPVDFQTTIEDIAQTANGNTQTLEIIVDQEDPQNRAVGWAWEKTNAEEFGWEKDLESLNLTGENLSDLILKFIVSGSAGSDFELILEDNAAVTQVGGEWVGHQIIVPLGNYLTIEANLQSVAITLDKLAAENPGFDWSSIKSLSFEAASDTGEVIIQGLKFENVRNIRERGMGVFVFQDNDFTPIDDWYGVKPAFIMSFKDLFDIASDDLLGEFQHLAQHGQTPYLTLEFWQMQTSTEDQENREEQFIARYGQEAYDNLLSEIEGENILASIAEGDYDFIIRDYARAIAAFGQPVLLRPFHEFNGQWYPWSIEGGQEDNFIAAWEKLYAIFQQEGADNALFVFSPFVLNQTGYDPVEGILSEIKDKVQIIACDGYGPSPEDPGGPEFNALFTEFIYRFQKFNLPMIIGEFGSELNKDSFFGAMDQELRDAVFPQLVGVTYFDIIKFERGIERDFGVSTISDTMQQMQADNFYKLSDEEVLQYISAFDELPHYYWGGSLQELEISLNLAPTAQEEARYVTIKVSGDLLSVFKTSSLGEKKFDLDLITGELKVDGAIITPVQDQETYVTDIKAMRDLVAEGAGSLLEPSQTNLLTVVNYLDMITYRIENPDTSSVVMPVVPADLETDVSGNVTINFVSGTLLPQQLQDFWAEVKYDGKTEYWDLDPNMLSSDGKSLSMQFNPSFLGKTIEMRFYGFDAAGRQTGFTNTITITYSASNIAMPVLPSAVYTGPDGWATINFVSGTLLPQQLQDFWAEVKYDGKTEYWDLDPSMLSSDGKYISMWFDPVFKGKTLEMRFYGFDTAGRQTIFTNSINIYVQ